MIPITSFAQTIQNGLNNNPYGIKFAVFTDASEYKDALITRTGKERYTNGIMRVGPSSVVPTRGVVVATQNVTLELLVQLPNPETDAQIITEHRAVLDGYFKQTSVQPYESDGKTYTVSALYSLAETGDVMVRPNVCTSITFTIEIEYSYVENGLNSNDCVFTLDGAPIPFTAAKITKSPDTQADAFADGAGKGMNINISFVRSFDFVVPSLSTPLGEIILDQVFGDALNTVHTLVAQLGDETHTYTVVFGQADAALEGISNVGHTISLIEWRT